MTRECEQDDPLEIRLRQWVVRQSWSLEETEIRYLRARGLCRKDEAVPMTAPVIAEKQLVESRR